MRIGRMLSFVGTTLFVAFIALMPITLLANMVRPHDSSLSEDRAVAVSECAASLLIGYLFSRRRHKRRIA